ncbi:MAG: pyruvate flavodoxin/ferredoxin oxidoreductase [Deltaproteobacteria bacterium SG8_13]|nr:MAG: pyruvate flavodoxin/ferredoxin oxidoreductase [Deltaproteobacteria bacterium SG8_13]
MAPRFLEGNEAVAMGALTAGCRFFAGYPITPATTIFNAMLRLLPATGGVCIQGEDEIASMGYCLGASMAGWKSMTATSGPGISLYSEQISFAVGSEIPIVIVDVQRLGPSTGSATRGADGDIQFLRWGNSGGLPVIVLAPVDAADCYLLTIHAFNLAETYRCPVFLASNKEIAMTRESVDLDALHVPDIIDRKPPLDSASFQPFQVSEKRRTPYFLPIGGSVPVRQTSSTHGADGYITTDAKQISENQWRLKKKLEAAVEKFTFFDEQAAESDTLVISYGVTARAAADATDLCRRAGRSVGLLVLKTLWPVPAQMIRNKAERYRRVVVVEMNLGQYVQEIQRVLADRQVEFYGQMDGQLITPIRIKEVIDGR